MSLCGLGCRVLGGDTRITIRIAVAALLLLKIAHIPLLGKSRARSGFTDVLVMEFHEIQRIYLGWELVGGWLGPRCPDLAVPVAGALVGFVFKTF